MFMTIKTILRKVEMKLVEHPTMSITIALRVIVLPEIQHEFLHLVLNQRHPQQHP
jgi:hypothetical protein